MRALIRLLRPHQYIKNGFVLLGLLFATQRDAATATHAALAFLAFCAMASAVYVLNDLLDAEADRQHPQKSRRPIASGQVSVPVAWCACVLLAGAALTLGAAVGLAVPLLLLTYLALNVAYSLYLKHVVILDVFVISAGFMLRILVGTVGIGIAPSQWLLLCGLMVTLFLGFAKRHAELMQLAAAGPRAGSGGACARRVLDDYSGVMLGQFIAVSAACTVLSYSLYTVSRDTIATHGTANLIYTVPFVVYGIFRYLFLLHLRAQGNDTAHDLLTDRHLLLTVASWLAVTIGVLP
ncbi:decaprenyl-phosphate phosphoribosyltransferase [Janthinobacterium rivuli]|uniref:decaprenyl-phosphate phosphoribosyltransferase n=1 Tax=Janthinobacterium sp. FT68W TaxID=2654255 RepID=UPI001265A32B|nr:decaprenyl-phosphate phosphoribosyltransferase [Janthinobacterium sp. FT68W]KAB8044180.1 decaprenyl-phosphate phosphoribosyltransferase [Janthinobacterium sp. FT68W]